MKSATLMTSHLDSSVVREPFGSVCLTWWWKAAEQVSCRQKRKNVQKPATFFLRLFKGFLLFARCHVSPVCHGWSRGKLVLLCQGRRRDENAACCVWGWVGGGGAGRVCCCLCTDSDSYARIPPAGKSYKKDPDKRGITSADGRPDAPLTKSKQGGGAADTTWGLWNSSNPVSLDRYWQSLMRSRVWSLQLPTNLYVCVTARERGRRPAEARCA